MEDPSSGSTCISTPPNIMKPASGEDKAWTKSPTKSPPKPPPTEGSPTLPSSFIGINFDANNIQNKHKIVSCPECKKKMNVKSIYKHMRHQHNKLIMLIFMLILFIWLQNLGFSNKPY